MTVLPDELVTRARELAQAGSLATWPAALLDEDLDVARARLQAALAWAPPAVAEGLARRLATAEDLGLGGMAWLWTAALAGAAGWSVLDAGPRALTVAREDRRALLVPVPIPGRHRREALAAELERRLGGVFEGRAWALVFREALPADVDLERVLEPIRMWLVAVDRGRWDGDYAIYEDAGVSLELRLLEGERPGLRLRMPPVGVDRLTLQIEAHGGAALEGLGDTAPDLPRVLVLARGERWTLPTGHRRELLYGKLHEAVAGPDGQVITVRHDGRSLYGRQPFTGVAATWWLWPDAACPTAPGGFAEDNPWCPRPGGPTFPGERLVATFVGDLDEPRARATLATEDRGRRPGEAP